MEGDEPTKVVTFLVVSCDKYSDIWPVFFQQMSRNWPDCPYQVCLLTNELDFQFNGVTVIKTGPDIDYSTQVRCAVESIKTPWLILWLEDCVFSERINSARVEKIVQSAIEINAGYLKLSDDYPLSYDETGSSEFGPTPRNVRYRSAVGMALYRRDTLLKLFPPGLSAWELDKSSRSNQLSDSFYCLTLGAAKQPPLPYVNTVIKGRWYLPAIPFLKEIGFGNAIPFRKRQSIKEFLACKVFVIWVEILKMFRIHWFDSSSKVD
jgi:hypothetical protein